MQISFIKNQTTMRSYFSRYIYSAVIVAMVAITPACNKKLDVVPGQNISPDQITTAGDVDATILGAYKSMQHYNAYGERYFLISDMMANSSELEFVGTFQNYADIFFHRQQKTNSIPEGIWDRSYQIINACNIVLDKIDLVTDADMKAQLTGEAKFIRAIAYYNLSGLFGKPYSDGNLNTNLAVPLVLEPVLSSDDISKGDVARATVGEVYTVIENDLKDAAANLPESNDTRANKFAAWAFLARLYMAEAKYPLAAAAADSVIESGMFNLTANFSQAFGNSANSSEDIFAIQQTNQSNAGTENNGMTTFYGSYPTGRGDVQVNTAILDLYEDGDDRKAFVYDGGSISGIDGVYTGKWATLYSNLPVVRLAEMYLTRAEANIRNGSAVGDAPLNDVNTVRSRSHATPLATVTANDVVQERFRELPYEGDKLWTIKRLKLSTGTRPYNDPKLTLPIPQREIDVNGKLQQNDSY